MAERYEAESGDIRSALADALAATEAPPEEAPAETQEQPEETASEAAEAPETEQSEGEAEAAPQPGAKAESEEKPTEKTDVEPPAHWSQGDKDRFKSAPTEWKQWLLDRHRSMEGDYSRKMNEVTALKREYEPIDKIFKPWSDQMKQAGVSPARLIEGWANVEQRLMAGQGVDVLKGVIQSYRIDPMKLVQALGLKIESPKAADGSELDPRVLEIINKQLEPVKQALTSREQAEQSAIIAAQHAELNRINSDIEKFKSATNEKGEPLHPHFADVEQDMIMLAQYARARGEKPTLEALYDQALWANTSVRQRILSEREAAAQAQIQAAQQTARQKTDEEARAKAAKAKRAGSSVTGSPGLGQTQKMNGTSRTLRDEIAANVADAEAAA